MSQPQDSHPPEPTGLPRPEGGRGKQVYVGSTWAQTPDVQTHTHSHMCVHPHKQRYTLGACSPSAPIAPTLVPEHISEMKRWLSTPSARESCHFLPGSTCLLVSHLHPDQALSLPSDPPLLVSHALLPSQSSLCVKVLFFTLGYPPQALCLSNSYPSRLSSRVSCSGDGPT